MVDRQDRHEVAVLVDLVDDSKVASSSTVLALQVEPERSPDPMRVLGETAVHELDARGCYLLRQTIE